MSIVLQGSTSGSVTLQEPAVAGTTVLTLPAVTGNVLTDTSPKAGNVIQVVQGTVKDTASSTTSTSFVSASLTASITPTASSSKILVMVNGVAYASSTNESKITVYRNATTNLGNSDSGFQKATSGNTSPISFQYLDSPATTSSTSYDVFFRANAGTAYFGESIYRCVIILMEIAG